MRYRTRRGGANARNLVQEYYNNEEKKKQNIKNALALFNDTGGPVTYADTPNTPLMLAASNNEVTSENMDEMLTNESILRTLNNQDSDGRTALHKAVIHIANQKSTNIDNINNAISKIKSLIEAGADNGIEDKYNKTPVELVNEMTGGITKDAVFDALFKA